MMSGKTSRGIALRLTLYDEELPLQLLWAGKWGSGAGKEGLEMSKCQEPGECLVHQGTVIQYDKHAVSVAGWECLEFAWQSQLGPDVKATST